MSKGLFAAFLTPVVAVPAAVIGIATAYIGNNAGQCGPGGIGAQGSVTSTVVSGNGQNALNEPIKVVSTSKGAVSSQLAVSMHFGSNIEDPAADPHANGAGGIGWYQIQDPGLPGGPNPSSSPADAADPLRSTLYMAPRYVQALNTVNKSFSSRWATLDGAEHNAEMVADLAEKPQLDYYVNRADAVGPAFQLARKQLAASGIPLNFATGNSGSTLTSTGLSGVSNCTSPGDGTTIVVPPDVSNAPQRSAVLTAAHGTINTMYAWAGGDANGPTYGAPPDVGVLGYDCSGLVLYALAQGKVHIPGMIHSSSNQYDLTRQFTTATSTRDLSRVQPGDLVFFIGDGDGGSFNAPGHVGIYIGNGQMIDAPQSGEKIRTESIVGRTDFVAATDPYRAAIALHRA